MISINGEGDYKKTEEFLKNVSGFDKEVYDLLEEYARKGVDALKSATPYRSGTTASSWFYEIEATDSGYIIHFNNSNINYGPKGPYNIALIIQRGHGTKNGGYVRGINYINPALGPVFKDIADSAWRGVTKKL